MEKVLITGISGGLGRLLTRRLRGQAEICGVDVLPWRGHPAYARIYNADLRGRKFEDVLRTQRPGAIIHLGFVRDFKSSEKHRHDVNVRGTQKVLGLCVKYGIEKLCVLSTSYVYGAFAENPHRMDEDVPLSASRAYPEIRDLVEVDTIASAFIWRCPEVATSVLRPVSVLGPHMHSMAASLMRLPRVPTVLGFNPMMQFISEEDLCEAIVLALDVSLRGVYNVVGSGEVPIHTAIREVGGKALRLPEFLVRPIFDRLFRLGAWPYPSGVLDYFKFPVSLDGDRFAAATGYKPRVDLLEMFEGMRQ